MIEANKNVNTRIEKTFSLMEKEAREILLREGFEEKKQRHERLLAVRYKGQSFELDLRFVKNLNIADAFHKAHEARYGYKQESNTVEIVSVRLRSSGVVEKVKTKREIISKFQAAKPHDYKQVFLSSKAEKTRVYQREKLGAGMRLVSPCIVTEYSATTLVPKDANAFVDEFGNLIVNL